MADQPWPVSSSQNAVRNVFIIGKRPISEIRSSLSPTYSISTLTAYNKYKPNMLSLSTRRHFHFDSDYLITTGTDPEQQHRVQIKQIFAAFDCHMFWLADNDRLYVNAPPRWKNGPPRLNQLKDGDIAEYIVDAMLVEGISAAQIKDIRFQPGYRRSIVLDTNGAVYYWWYPTYKQAQDPISWHTKARLDPISFFVDQKVRIKLIAAGASHSSHAVFVDTDDGVWSAGLNRYGQCALAKEIRSTAGHGGLPQQVPYFRENKIAVSDVQCGNNHTLLLSQQGRVYAWGWNRDGQCGIQDAENPESTVFDELYSPTMIDALKEEKIVQIKCGLMHSYVRSECGKHYLFGCNESNECALRKGSMSKIRSPLCINETVRELTNGRCVTEVYLEHNLTCIVASYEVQYICICSYFDLLCVYMRYISIVLVCICMHAQLLVIGFVRLEAKQYVLRISEDLMNVVFAFLE